MRITRSSWLVLACLLAGCNTTPPSLAPNVVESTNPSTEADPNAEVPDAVMTQLAATGINAGVLLGPLMKQYADVANAYFTARSQYGKGSYRLFDFGGWTFQNGWYHQSIDNGASTLQTQFTDANGTPPTWDVTLASNYDPDLHPTFPSDLTQVRFQVDKQLPSNGRMAITMFATLGKDAGSSMDASGSGSITLPAPLGQAQFEGLSATFKPGNDVDGGQIVLKSLVNASTLQFSGTFVKTGLSGQAQLIKNGHAAGNVVFDAASGKWQIVNSKGTFPVQ